MPKTNITGNKELQISMWAITEPTNELESLCLSSWIEKRKNFALEDRYKQFLVTQLLHKEMFGDSILTYANTGKPMVNNDVHISISHTSNFVVMMRSQHACGIDIEKVHERVEKVKHKFLNDEELLRVEGASPEILVRYWCAKEAMFKVYGSQDVFMRSNIFVSDFSDESAVTRLTDGDLEIIRKIKFHEFDSMMLAWTEMYNEK